MDAIDTSAPVYERPTVVEVGDFSELTLGSGGLALEVNGTFGPNP